MPGATRSWPRRAARSPSAPTPRPATTCATTGTIRVSPGIATAFNGVCEVALDQRAFDGDVLADMLAAARTAAAGLAAEEGCEVEWEHVWAIDPIRFDPGLIALAEEVVTDVAGSCHRCRAARCTTPPRWRA